MIRTLLIASSLAVALLPLRAAAQTLPAKPANLVTVDASVQPGNPETGYLHLGGTSANGHSLQVNSRYLVLDGHPWLPVMGEIHFSRLPESTWEDEILKMKAAGIDIIATYIFWIHHEEIEGQFDWSGQRDLRRFVQLCAKHGMYVWLRPGPWDHGEVRNGGFPDWLNRLPNTRTNDPAYIHYVERFFHQIGAQVQGLMFKDGGPVIGAQLENEYGLHGPGRGAEHILKLKQLAIAAGIDPPIFSVTGWPSLDFPPQEVIPVSGGYPDGFWYGSQQNLPPSITYLFNFNRELGDMGATVASEDPTGKVDLAHDPYFAAEEAGGMATAYHRRPLLDADDIAALTLTGIGSGINLYGYYMFHGGTNPHGLLTTLQESQATGYPNDLPEYTYDFQAPLGAFGQQRDSYVKTRLIHLFLNAYGADLAPMAAYAPLVHGRDPADTATPRVAVRAGGNAGFVFVNNYVRQLSMPARPGFQVHVKLPAGEISLPAKPLTMPADTYFAWPFNLPLGAARLRYGTAQLLTRLDTPQGKLIVFYATPGIAPEFAFDASGVKTLSAPGAHSESKRGITTLSELTPGMNSMIQLVDAQGAHFTLLLLTKSQAEQTSLLHAQDSDHLIMTRSTVLFDGTQLHLRSTASPTQHFSSLPALTLDSGAPSTEGLWTTYTFSQPEQQPSVSMQQTQKATPRATMAMGPYVDWRKAAVPIVPPDSAFQQAATWQLTLGDHSFTGLSQLLLQVTYTGDVGRLSADIAGSNTILDDNFFDGIPWVIGLKDLGKSVPAQLTLQILPMPTVFPIYVDARARAQLNHAPANPTLAGIKLIPEYESVINVSH